MIKTKENIEYLKDTKQLARFAKALGHPTRIRIIKYLSEQSFCFTGELVDFLPLAQSTISQHLKELKDAGLIRGEVNPPKVRYCIDKENWEKAGEIFCDLFKIDFSGGNCVK